MEFIKSNWLLILILVIVAIITYRYYKKTKDFKDSQVLDGANGQLPFYNGGSGKSNGTSGGGGASAGDTYVPPAKNYNSSTFAIGDKLYAGDKGTNIFNTKSYSDIKKFFLANQFIGTFLANEGDFIKIISPELNTGISSYFMPISYPEVYVTKFGNQVYKK